MQERPSFLPALVAFYLGAATACAGSEAVENAASSGGGSPAADAAPNSGSTGSGASGGDGGAAGGEGGAAATGPWSCVGEVVWPQAAVQTIDVTLVLTDIVSGLPVAGLSVKACARTDTSCATPLHMAQTDAMGSATLSAPIGPGGFDGYVQVTGSDTAPSLLFYSPPLVESVSPLYAVVVSKSVLGAVAGLSGVELDPQRAQVVVGVEDCAQVMASGVVVSSTTADDQTKTTYFDAQNLPISAATSTTENGIAALLDLPPGTTTIEGALEASGKTVASLEVLTRPGFVTFTNLPPTP